MDPYKYSILDTHNNLLKRSRLLSHSNNPMECSSCREFHLNNHVSEQMSLEAHLCQESYEKEQSELLIVHQAETIEFQSNYIRKLEAILQIPSSGKRIPGFPSSVQKEYDARIRKDSVINRESSQMDEDTSTNLWKTPDWPVTGWEHLPPTWVDEPATETMSEETPVSQTISSSIPSSSRKGKGRAKPIRSSQLGETLWKKILEQEAQAASSSYLEAIASKEETETDPVSAPSPSNSSWKETEFLIKGRPLLPDRHF